MWRLKQFIPKDQGNLEGKSVDVGPLKLQVRSTIAQGGFSCVYLARDAVSGRNYALKHIICNDVESVDMVKSEVAVMKVLRGHPNVVMLHAQVIYDMGRTKECFVVMDFCDKMLVNVLETRGAGYFDEKQLLLIFRDICNAVYAMHCQSPPVAHRDLKAENVLMGADGLWKLCDFGSTSTNHKRFELPDEMGVEEDIIRKHTTPAYRAPEMWDLYRRELISEKVDIWALGCLLYRIAYFKSAFDGESKLQILNGNYRIPEAPRYSTVVTDLIREMLTANPEARPDVMQVWRRVNDSLPPEIRKPHPDKPASMSPLPTSRTQPDMRSHGSGRGSPIIPSRSPPLVPGPRDIERRITTNGTGSSGISAGAFWSTPYAKCDEASSSEKAGPSECAAKLRPGSPSSRSRREISSHLDQPSGPGIFLKKNPVTNLMRKVHTSGQNPGAWVHDNSDHNGYETRLEPEDLKQLGEDGRGYLQISSPLPHESPAGKSVVSNDLAFNEFSAHLELPGSHATESSSSKIKEHLHEEIERLKQELHEALAEKATVSSKYEKLTAICRSQRQEIQDLKGALASTSRKTVMGPKGQTSPTRVFSSHTHLQVPQAAWQAFDQPKEKPSGTVWDLQEGLSPSSVNIQRNQPPDSPAWQAFSDSPRQLGADGRRRPQQHTRAASMGGDGWGFVQDSFSTNGSVLPTSVVFSSTSSSGNTNSYTESRGIRPTSRTQPAGWAGF